MITLETVEAASNAVMNMLTAYFMVMFALFSLFSFACWLAGALGKMRRELPLDFALGLLLFAFLAGADGKGPGKSPAELAEAVKGVITRAVKGGGAPAVRGAPEALPEGWAAKPDGAAVHERWTRYGINQDTFYLAATNWAFPVRGVPVRGLWAS